MSDAIPKSGEYAEGLLWFERSGSLLTLGVTNTAIEEVGTAEEIDFPDQGSDFIKGEVILTVTGSDGSVDVICPAAGVIQEINGATQEDPSLVSEDPHEEGWLVKVEIQDPSDLKEFLSD